MLKRIALIAMLVLLAGCATERYYPVQVEGGGHYIAEREYATTGYDSLWAFGVYPWWVHSFHTPYYYPYSFSYFHPFYYPYYGPYHFAGWYPSWPYYTGYPHYAMHPRHATGRGVVAPGQKKPGRGAPALPMRPKQVADERQKRAIGGRAALREDLYRRPSQAGGVSPGLQRLKSPVDTARRSKAIAPRPSVASPVRRAAPTGSLGSEPRRSPRPPADHSRSERLE